MYIFDESLLKRIDNSFAIHSIDVYNRQAHQGDERCHEGPVRGELLLSIAFPWRNGHGDALQGCLNRG